MKLLDTYALYCGAKIDKPFIYEVFFPLPFEKYITFQAQTPYDSRNYAYWQDVIDIIAPILQSVGIRVVQLGLGNEAPYQRIIDLRGQTNFHQLAYVLKRSMLHLGPDSFGVHLASSFDIPIVALYSISMTEVAGPHFGSPEKQVLFKGYERVGNKKPSYSPQESPKSINTIKPEEVADAVFKLLGLDFKTPFRTVYSGPRYSNQIIRELIPNTTNVMPMPDQPIELRLDLHQDEQILPHHLGYWQKSILVTNKPISTQLLRQFKPHIALVAYHVTENDSPNFVKEVVSLGIPLVLLTRLPEEVIQQKKIHYYEYGLINKIPIPDPALIESLREKNNLYYRSCKLIASGNHIFNSLAEIDGGTPMSNDFEYRKVIDSPKFWQDLEFMTIVEKI